MFWIGRHPPNQIRIILRIGALLNILLLPLLFMDLEHLGVGSVEGDDEDDVEDEHLWANLFVN